MKRPGTIVLLMTAEEVLHFMPILVSGPLHRLINPADAAELEDVSATFTGPARLISFCSSVIVPGRILRRFSAGAYNFHPGPPEYRGAWPSVFALRDGVDSFGVTFHSMTAVVDSGPIHAVRRFPLSANENRITIETKAYSTMLLLAEELKDGLRDLEHVFPPTEYRWTGPLRFRRDAAS